MKKESVNMPYQFDDASVAYSKLTDQEAKERVQKVKDRIKELKSNAELSQDPRKIFELRELVSALAWYRANKNRSKYFKVISSGASMRRANRHPDVGGFKRRGKSRQKRKKV